MKALFLILATLSLAIHSTVRIVANISFNRQCSGYLERAANANTVELAARELGRALDHLEKEKLTTGFTSILYRTPDEDVGFWYENLKASLTELRATKADASPLERSNVLMKLRETLIGHGESGEHLTIPDGLTVYPQNGILALWGWLSLVAVMGFGVVLLADQ